MTRGENLVAVSLSFDCLQPQQAKTAAAGAPKLRVSRLRKFKLTSTKLWRGDF
jgi:hypothetical protein